MGSYTLKLWRKWRRRKNNDNFYKQVLRKAIGGQRNNWTEAGMDGLADNFMAQTVKGKLHDKPVSLSVDEVHNKSASL